MLLNFNFDAINNIPIENKILDDSDYNPKTGDVIDFHEHLVFIGYPELPSDFIVTNITFHLCGNNTLEKIIWCSVHQNQD